MERTAATSRISKTQRETHSEIERRRRERMKRDTEFLRRQVSNPQCKDKLSIFQAGAERLIEYTDKLGKREYIINDEEYSHIIMSSFDGFSIHVRCTDAVVLAIHENVVKILDLSTVEIVGHPLQDLAEPSSSTKKIIADAFGSSELQWDIFKGLISRNFVIAIRCGPAVPLHHCVYGSDGNVYRFVEFCGDMMHESDGSTSDNSVVVFRGLCRPLDPASGTIVEAIHADNGDVVCSNTQHFFTLRLTADDFHITEAVGEFEAVLGYTADQLLNRQLGELTIPAERDQIDRMLKEVQSRSPTFGRVHLLHTETQQLLPFDSRFSAIRLGSCFHCIVCRLDLFEPNLANVKLDHDASEVGSLHPDPSARPCWPLQLLPRDTHELVRNQGNPAFSTTHQSFSGQSFKPEPTCHYRQNKVPLRTSTSGKQTAEDEWFQNVDTTSFQSLLSEDQSLFSECLIDMLHNNSVDS